MIQNKKAKTAIAVSTAFAAFGLVALVPAPVLADDPTTEPYVVTMGFEDTWAGFQAPAWSDRG